MDYAIYTFGCKVNQVETQAMEAELCRRGHRRVPFADRADAYIVNTCTVTAVGDKKCRILIRQTRKRAPEALLAVCGCYGQMEPETIAALGADLVSGTGDRPGFLDQLEAKVGEKGGTKAPSCPSEAPAPCPPGRTRAMLKVEDGCCNFCSYCIIPYARGPVRSMALAEAVSEVKRLAAEGYRELVVTGIEISSWRDGEKQLTDLVEAICAAAPNLRIRLGSLEPRSITEEFCRRLQGYHNLCPHFHLSLQSGSDTVLGRMNRKYDTARYYESVKLLRAYFQTPAITTDLIVGFPGETQGELEESLAFLQTCGFAAVHVFPYSRRPGTPADKLAGQLGNAEKEARAVRARALAAELTRTYLQTWVGQSLPVLFEDFHKGTWRGHTTNYMEVHAAGEGLHNTEHLVKITAVEGETLLGILI
ncbi:MAG: tRNA (N(6)-L-threonylcarbamoyladenosine(37)-C(2))-methylthiotransferase MtaB [Pseudoflavonifractor sp.]